MVRIKYNDLLNCVKSILLGKSCTDTLAECIARILVEADARGINSHGVSRLNRYLNYIDNKYIDVYAQPEILFETPVSMLIDAKNAAGQYAGEFAMNKCMEKALQNGICMATVKNSNHYGIAGYYSEIAAKRGMMGISMTNTAPLVVPTNGSKSKLGTNPIAVAIPIKENIFSLDMATSVASRGKIEVLNRKGEEIPCGWFLNESGEESGDPKKVLECLARNEGGGLLPLGGRAEVSGGHKGYGLSILVELLTAGLSAGTPSSFTYGENSGICHFFAAIKMDVFGDVREISGSLDFIINDVRESGNGDKIWIHGEKERERYEYSLLNGVGIDEAAYRDLKSLDGNIEAVVF